MGCSITYRDFKQMYAMGNMNFPSNAMKNSKIYCSPQVSRVHVVVTLCVYGGFCSGLDVN